MALIGFRAPALPLPREQYDRRQQDQLLNALRLYFNQLDSLAPIQSDFFVGGGWRLTFPHIAASDSTDQLAGGNDDPTVVTWDTLEAGFGWTLNAPGSATAQYAGVYKITYSIQVANTATNAAHSAVFWLKVNNTDVANSATEFSVAQAKSNSIPTFICAYSEATFTMQAGDTVELYWATDQAATSTTGATRGIYLFHDAAITSPYARPAIPSAIGSITFVSALP